VDECRAIVRRIAGGRAVWHASFLAPRSLPQIAERVLNNLVRLYEGRERWPPLHRTLTFLLAARPDAAQPLLHRGLVALRLGAAAWARRDLEEVARRFAGTAEADVAARRLAGLKDTLLHCTAGRARARAAPRQRPQTREGGRPPPPGGPPP